MNFKLTLWILLIFPISGFAFTVHNHLTVLTLPLSTTIDHLYLGSPGRFTWKPQNTISVGNTPRSVFIGDANNDGLNDIVTADFDEDVSILRWNNTSDNWDADKRYVGDNPHSVIVDDANNDGENDIVTVNYYTGTVAIITWNRYTKDWDAPDDARRPAR